ncbi:hypothetical protein JAAARDRAFT_36865 [Jaapia argillacea MUCL 33604]|uniref:Uncharacterized protein n=1 Tax=Jaapia argillacea MUCL 33604 TaxID=933084 RepID=A0A067PQI5_9AGAM|nr:hypothetical protein JAAARDRAFT_36865 [Jaapia argillacea MUCL 33604]
MSLHPTSQAVRNQATLRVLCLHPPYHLHTVSTNWKLVRPITHREVLGRDTMLGTSDRGFRVVRA